MVQMFKIIIGYKDRGYYTANDIVDSIVDNLDCEREDVDCEEVYK